MEAAQKHLYVLILAGGGGTRLWPLSRDKSPKQFAKLFNGKSLFQLALPRAKKLTSNDHIFICTSAKYVSLVKKQAIGIPSENIIGEPIRRDTAIAMGLGALYIYRQDPDAVIVNLACDHLISPLDLFTRQLTAAAQVAYTTQKIVTVGIVPTYPHTGLGHIKFGKMLNDQNPKVYQGLKFVEKPPLELAKKYTTSGKYLWNANYYVYKADTYLNALHKHAPKSYAGFPRILKAIGTDRENETIQAAFQMAPVISIDYAVTEKLREFICVAGTFNWTDVGYWDVVWQNLPKDSLGNVIQGNRGKGEYIGINSQNNLLFLDKRIVATVGLENIMIIDTPDALLVCPKNQAQDVKKVVEALKENKLNKYL